MIDLQFEKIRGVAGAAHGRTRGGSPARGGDVWAPKTRLNYPSGIPAGNFLWLSPVMINTGRSVGCDYLKTAVVVKAYIKCTSEKCKPRLWLSLFVILQINFSKKITVVVKPYIKCTGRQNRIGSARHNRPTTPGCFAPVLAANEPHAPRRADVGR